MACGVNTAGDICISVKKNIDHKLTEYVIEITNDMNM